MSVLWDLSPLDDFPFHQTSESMAHVATSDRNFYDRYYFNCTTAPTTCSWRWAWGSTRTSA